MPSASRSSVAISVSASQLIELIESVTSLVLKKRKVTAIIRVFYEKCRLKNNHPNIEFMKESFKKVLAELNSSNLKLETYF